MNNGGCLLILAVLLVLVAAYLGFRTNYEANNPDVPVEQQSWLYRPIIEIELEGR